MDAQRFDTMVKGFGSGANRRRVLGVLAGSLAAVLGGHQTTGAQGNSDCAQFCKEVFGPGGGRGQCINAAARGDADSLCAVCEANPANVCLGEDGEPTCECGCVRENRACTTAADCCGTHQCCFNARLGGLACTREDNVGIGQPCA